MTTDQIILTQYTVQLTSRRCGEGEGAGVSSPGQMVYGSYVDCEQS